MYEFTIILLLYKVGGGKNVIWLMHGLRAGFIIG